MTKETSRMDVVWNSDTTYALGFCRMLAQALGIWPLDCQNLFAKTRLLAVVILELSMAVNMTLEIMANCVAMDEMVNFVAMVACSLLASLKITVLRMNQTRMELVIRSAMEDWAKLVSLEERQIMKRYASTGRFVVIFQLGSCILCIVPLILASLPFLAPSPEENDRELGNVTMSKFNNDSIVTLLAFPTMSSTATRHNLPVGTDCSAAGMSDIMYPLVYVIHVIYLTTTAAGNVGTDVYFFGMTMHVSGQFEVLRMKFEKFGDNPDVQKCREELGRLVRRHNHLMKLSNNFEDTFNILILAQLSANTLHMSLLGIQIILSLQTGNGVVLIGAFIALCILSLQLFLYSYAGDNLTTQVEKLRYAAYCCRWYNLPPKVVRDLVFVMLKSNKEFHLTAGKVYCMNVDNFKNIIKAMGSYFSMLKIMFDDKLE